MGWADVPLWTVGKDKNDLHPALPGRFDLIPAQGTRCARADCMAMRGWVCGSYAEADLVGVCLGFTRALALRGFVGSWGGGGELVVFVIVL